MLPYEQRTPDLQYSNILRFILESGEEIQSTPQDVPAITSLEVPKMVFDLENGFPMITERDVFSFWKKPIEELFAFIRGVRQSEELEAVGCGWWKDWATEEKCAKRGLSTGDMGPGSYGAAFHDFPMPDGGTFNQFAHLIDQIRKYPSLRTLFVSPWIPFYIGRGGFQKAVVSPCHGWVHVRIVNEKLALHMFQRSADMPVGVPANMIQYAALTMVLASITGYKPWKYIHSFSDAHIYADQVEKVKELLEREPRPFPTLRLRNPISDIFRVRASDFELLDYNPHPSMKMPVAI